LPLLLSEWISASLSLKKRRGGVRVGVETETTISADEAPRSGRPRAHEIEENQNAKRCHNWIRARAGEMAAKRETTMSIGEEPSGGGVNPMPGTRVLDWILSDSDEGPSSGKEERAGGGSEVGEGPASRLRAQVFGNDEEGSRERRRCRDLVSDSGNDHDDSKASFSESHCLFTCSIDGA
jgi:hypothetical protein